MKYEDKYHPSDQLIFRSLEEDEFELTSDYLINLRARQFSRDHKSQLHYHNTLEIDINHGVCGSAWIDGDNMDLEELDVIVTPPGTLHSFDFIAGNGTFDVLHISLTTLGKYLNIKQIFGSDYTTMKRITYINPAYRELASIIEEIKKIEEKDFFSQLKLILDIFGILFKELRYYPDDSKESNILKKVIDFTELNYHKNIDLNTISSFAGLSRSYFSRYFKSLTGTGYFTYLTLMRLDKAKEKIREGQSITESCYNSGFENVSYFIQLFKKHNDGLSPGKYRTKLYE
ncbi:AraC family transcriptional regulator [Oceanispirochaeta crateris]|uniref:AraC family transcriptional regulator n=1 Tax=Oceanispirochaeta crateris TaxID=2518645 RepID=A0A5C1QLJ8_9SPIO|nr:AraC family transcriptional regulator [Oceanispirochaeta crateris]QEN08347.1 AraC family transcriptional regulator [Oceanispirochaeta crateris]